MLNLKPYILLSPQPCALAMQPTICLSLSETFCGIGKKGQERVMSVGKRERGFFSCPTFFRLTGSGLCLLFSFAAIIPTLTKQKARNHAEE